MNKLGFTSATAIKIDFSDYKMNELQLYLF